MLDFQAGGTRTLGILPNALLFEMIRFLLYVGIRVTREYAECPYYLGLSVIKGGYIV